MRYAQRGGYTPAEQQRRERLRLEAAERFARGDGINEIAPDLRWTLGRIKTLIGKLFHVGYTPEGVWKLMRRHGWSCQVPVRQALERDEEAVAVWKAEVWPDIKEWRATWAPTSASRTRQARG